MRLLILILMLCTSGAFAQVLDYPSSGGSGSVAGGSATNAQPPSTILTNLSSTGAITNINEGNVLYVRTNGLDSTAVRGRLDKPFLTVTGANAAAIAGDLVQFGRGVFDVGSNVVNFKHGVTFKGEGMLSTVINGTNGTPLVNGPQFRPGSGVIRDLTFRTRDNNNTKYGFGFGGSNPQLCTNALIENVWFEGDTDAIYMMRPDDGIPTSIRFRNCLITSGYDVCNLGGGTNSVFDFENCTFIVTVSGQTNTMNLPQSARFLVTQNSDGQGAVIRFRNCSFQSYDALGAWNWYDGDFGDGPYCAITWDNCTWSHSLTNGGTFFGWQSFMDNTNSFLNFIGANFVDWKSSAAIVTNTPGPQRVTMTSAGASTNWLPHIHFVNNWTNVNGVSITIADGAQNTARIVRTLGNALITGPHGSHTSYTNTRAGWRATFRTHGTNWLVEEESLPLAITDLTVRSAFEASDTATFQSLVQLYGPINDAYLTGPAVTGINENGDRTNIVVASDFALSATGPTLSLGPTVTIDTLIATNPISVLGTGNGEIFLRSSNATGGISIQPQHNLPVVITNKFDFTNFAPGQILTVISSNMNTVLWGVSNAPAGGGSQTPWTSDINGGGNSLSNAFRLSLGTTNVTDQGAQNPSIVIMGTNASGQYVAARWRNTNSGLSLDFNVNDGGYGTTPFRFNSDYSIVANGGLLSGASGNFQSAFAQIANSGYFYWNGRSTMYSPANGTIQLNNSAADNFTGLSFGGATAAFPAIGRTNGHLRVQDGTLSASTVSTNGMIVDGGIFYPTNTIIPSATQLGLGGYWVGNSNGNLVTVYSLNGTTTAMKVLAP